MRDAAGYEFEGQENWRLLRVRNGPGRAKATLGVFATGEHNPAPQWRRPGRYAVDLEGIWFTDGPEPSPHIERSFPGTEAGLARALEFARFLEWAVDGLSDEQLVECAKVADGRLL
jgi:hypothetical protein